MYDDFIKYGCIVICKNWGKCKDGEIHWAYYNVESPEQYDYWIKERVDEEQKLYWRHYEFLGIPCNKCGEISPLRASDCFIFQKQKLNYVTYYNYHPEEQWPDFLEHKSGWSYTYFKENMTDSLFGQATFKLRKRNVIDKIKQWYKG